MLIVSSTEPRTLRNCNPPQTHRAPTDKAVGRTVPVKPLPCSPVQGRPWFGGGQKSLSLSIVRCQYFFFICLFFFPQNKIDRFINYYYKYLSSTNQKISGSIPGSSSPYIDVSIGKILNPKLVMMGRLLPCMAAPTISVVSVV